MADTKFTDLTAQTSVADTDIMVSVVDPATTPVAKKITWANIKATLKTYFDSLYPSGSGTSTGTNTGDQTNITGNAATVTTNANLTGVVTSVGNATAIADNALSIAKISGLQTALDGKEVPLTFGDGLTRTVNDVDIDAEQPQITTAVNLPWTGLKPGTDGEIPTFDASGNPAFVAVGTATHVLTSNGAGAAPTFQAPAGGATARLRKTYSFDTIPGTDSQAGIYYISSSGGTIAFDGGGYLISTGATNSAYLHIAFRNRYSDNVDGWGKNPELIFIANHSTKSTGSAVIQITVASNGNEALSNGTFTVAHMGFLICVVGGTRTVYATNADSTTQTKTDVTAYFTAGTHQVYRAVMTSGTNIKFYIDGTLVATHTTNLPSTGWTSQGDIWNDSDTGTSANNALKLTHLEYSLDA